MLKPEPVRKWHKKNSGSHFIRKTMREISSILQNEILSERFARQGNLFKNLDPRVRLLTTLIFLVWSGLTQSPFTLILLVFTAVILIKFSGLNLKAFFIRIWLFIPPIVFVLSIPAATNLFIQGNPVFFVYKNVDAGFWFIALPRNLYFTFEGLKAIVMVTLRIGISLSYAYLLIMTTGWTHVAHSLYVLKVPSFIISLLHLTYRYIFLLSRIALEIMESAFLRTIGKVRNKKKRSFLASRISFLFIKSSYMSNEIYDAMVCRGYSGKPVTLIKFKFSLKDLFWLVNVAGISVILLIGEILF
ncbi:MAG: cobalt ECF transporter T component CbiQ [Spirochaetales bacterium]|nr:cobalt ECF transporter T component CbiQ [Spirochaetales bacterium]